MNLPMNWLVFGAGAIGTYVGGSLLYEGHQVTFLEQPSTAQEIRQRGLHLQLNGQLIKIPGPFVVASMEEAKQNAPFDAAFFALKSFDTQPALNQLTPHLQWLPPIICLQNGVENEILLAALLGNERVIAGTVTSAVRRRAAGDVILERKRGIGLSSLHPRSGAFASALKGAGLNAHLYPSPLAMKWSKMLTNLVGNATSAILDLTPAQVFNHPRLYNLEIQQLRETLAVMRTLGITVINLPGIPVRWFALVVDHFPAGIIRPILQSIVGRGRGDKMPSFHIDLHSGRGQSEVDYLNGAVVRAGRRAGVPTPVNALLNQTLLGLISGELPKERFAQRPEALQELLPD